VDNRETSRRSKVLEARHTVPRASNPARANAIEAHDKNASAAEGVFASNIAFV
jgi:hypothetical protein